MQNNEILQQLKQQVEKYPNDKVGRFHFAKKLFENQNYKEAMDQLKLCDTSSAETQFYLGYTFWRLSQFDDAIKHYQSSLRLGNRSVRDEALTWNHLGAALKQQNRLEEATGAFNEGLSLLRKHNITEYPYELLVSNLNNVKPFAAPAAPAAPVASFNYADFESRLKQHFSEFEKKFQIQIDQRFQALEIRMSNLEAKRSRDVDFDLEEARKRVKTLEQKK